MNADRRGWKAVGLFSLALVAPLGNTPGACDAHEGKGVEFALSDDGDEMIDPFSSGSRSLLEELRVPPGGLRLIVPPMRPLSISRDEIDLAIASTEPATRLGVPFSVEEAMLFDPTQATPRSY